LTEARTAITIAQFKADLVNR